MLTIFSIPKPFRGHIGIIQENAIRSWLRLSPECEIILYGGEEGTVEVCNQYALSHIPHVKKNEFGTPTLDFIFDHVQTVAKSATLCYVNSDIILLEDFIATLQKIPFRQFLMTGQRWDADISERIDFDNPRCISSLKEDAMKKHKRFSGGIDYLAFPRGTFRKIPPFAVGRAGWDNWMIYHARTLKIPTIDATKTVTAIHQNHSYGHVPQGNGESYAGPESEKNFALAGGRKIYLWNLDDADWISMESGFVRKKTTPSEIFRRMILRSPPPLHPFLEVIFSIQHRIRYKEFF